ncbi:GDSL esterase/lipase At1g28570-like [Cornus florida]|uniref:GDSL esterase/lipase At1g28570-like n=1 Tax=Cornus florida TaxID=4283 RepID=UPI00289C5BFD|nr:GDSL esterase/lipase At1g28570-like [Cornus florida]
MADEDVLVMANNAGCMTSQSMLISDTWLMKTASIIALWIDSWLLTTLPVLVVEMGIETQYENFSLGVQLGWFKEMLPSLCTNASSDCNKLFEGSLVLMGTIGGNDYDNTLTGGISLEEVESFVPIVVNTIASAINELIELGVVTLMVPGIVPLGCTANNLAYYTNSAAEDYDPKTGCLTWLNKLSEYHNELLRIELNRIQELHPHTTISYADY